MYPIIGTHEYVYLALAKKLPGVGAVGDMEACQGQET